MNPEDLSFLGLPGPMYGRYHFPYYEEVLESFNDGEHNRFLEGVVPVAASRQPATQAEITAAGVLAAPAEILSSMRAENSHAEHAAKRARVEGNFEKAFKVYSNVDDDSGPEEERRRKTVGHDSIMDATGQKIQDFWFELTSNKHTHGLGFESHVSKEEFYKAVRPMADKIANAERQWQIKEYWDIVASDPVAPLPTQFKLFDSLCTCPELIIEVCKHLRPRDIINLYSMSRKLHNIVDSHMQSSVLTWARSMAPSSVGIFPSTFYRELYIPDPAGRPVDPAYYDMKYLSVPGQAPPEVEDNKVRSVLGLKWLDMVVTRHIRVRDIVATLARMGHRLPPKMHITLKKMWLLMDISTNMGRANMMRNEEIFTHVDLFLLHFFIVKLLLAFNDPVYGPESTNLMKLMLGQRSLSTLWAMLRRKKYTTRFEVRGLKVAYDIEPSAYDLSDGRPYYGVPVMEMGRGHTEGWGIGEDHLLRPDEFIGLEVARRQLNFSYRYHSVLVYGHFSFANGSATAPTLDEMYMSDDEEEADADVLEIHRKAGIVSKRIYKECGNVPFERWMWQPRHLKMMDWQNLSLEERIALEMEEQEEFSQTLDVDTVYYNFTARTRHLETLCTAVLESTDDVMLPTDPTGKVNGIFDPAAYARWGKPSIISDILGQVPADGVTLEPPDDWEMDWDALAGHDRRAYRDFLLEGEDDPLLDEEEHFGLHGTPEVDDWDGEEEIWSGILCFGGGLGGGLPTEEDLEGLFAESEDEYDDDDEGYEEYDVEEGEDDYGEEEEGREVDYGDEEEEGEEGYDEEIGEGGNWAEDREGDVEMVDTDDGLADDEANGETQVGSPSFRPINLPFRPQGS